MKTIKIENGEIRNGYCIDELIGEAAEKAINEHWDFLLSISETDEEARNIDQDYVVDSITANDYLFDEDGYLLPVVNHFKNGKLYKTTFGSKEYLCTIE